MIGHNLERRKIPGGFEAYAANFHAANEASRELKMAFLTSAPKLPRLFKLPRSYPNRPAFNGQHPAFNGQHKMNCAHCPTRCKLEWPCFKRI